MKNQQEFSLKKRFESKPPATRLTLYEKYLRDKLMVLTDTIRLAVFEQTSNIRTARIVGKVFTNFSSHAASPCFIKSL